MPLLPDSIEDGETNPIIGNLLVRALRAKPYDPVIMTPKERDMLINLGIDPDTVASSITKLSDVNIYVSGRD
ncbi:MAG: hypothetical protein AAB557_02780 [Patescibacteria group bacterium]